MNDAHNPRITVLIYTARGDHPYVDASWHCFDPFVRTLAAQTFVDFELVLVDMHWATRKDYFKDNPQPFPVKHVPSSPNFWQAQKRTGLCAQINRGFAWADGELVWMGGENNMFPPCFLEHAWKLHAEGLVPVAWYAICGGDRDPEGAKTAEIARAACPVDFDLLGFSRAHVTQMDHRGMQFSKNRELAQAAMHHQNYFGYAGVPTDTAVEINGFDELFDGQWGLFDCDFGSRIDLAGKKMAMHRNLFVIEPPVAPGPYAGIGHQEAFKCHYAIYLHNRATHRMVNARLPLGYVDDVKAVACRGVCGIKDKCAAGAPGIGEAAYYPFCEGKNAELAAATFANPPVRDLAAERCARKLGKAPYDAGSFCRPIGQIEAP